MIIAGDFNVDLFCASKRTDMLLSFMAELNLCAVDLACYPHVTYTYEHDNGKVTSWPDHILTLKHHSDSVYGVSCTHSPDNLSDHILLSFIARINLITHMQPQTVKSMPPHHTIDWDRVTTDDAFCYVNSIIDNLPALAGEVIECRDVDCKSHHAAIELYCEQLLDCIDKAAHLYLPKKKQGKVVPGWNENIKELKQSAYFWNNVWVDCGCPRAGVVFELRNRTKKEYKYSVRRAKRRRVHVANEKLGKVLCCKNSKAFWSINGQVQKI